MPKLLFLCSLMVAVLSFPFQVAQAKTEIYAGEQCDFIDFSRLRIKPSAITTQVVGNDTVVYINGKQAMKLRGKTGDVNYTTDKKNYYTSGAYNADLSRRCNSLKKR